jgi:hypothetical protein
MPSLDQKLTVLPSFFFMEEEIVSSLSLLLMVLKPFLGVLRFPADDVG